MHLSFHRRELGRLAVPRAHAATVGLADGRVAVLGGNTRRAGDVATGVCEVGCRSSGVVEIVDVERGEVTGATGLRAAREAARTVRIGKDVLVMGGIADHG